MSPDETSAVWTAIPPTSWPSPPAEMTVTNYGEIAACPRRWALKAADYPGVWSGRGYPARLQIHALAGSVVHLALESITRQLVRVGCPSVDHPSATEVLKDLGGYTKIVHDCIGHALERFTQNPRAVPLIEHATRTLRGQTQVLRTRVQSILARVRLRPSQSPAVNEGGGGRHRGPLGTGAFPEIELRAKRLGWKGKADLLVISEESCEITDFKTGEPDDAHKFQLQVYGLLWSLDEDLNPARRPADRLVLAYESGDVPVAAPNVQELATFEKELIERRAAAEASLSTHPPEARPSLENCRYCEVRQLCDKYWSVEGISKAADDRFGDVELKVLRRHGPSSWDAVVVLSSAANAGKTALLRTQQALELKPGMRVRVLDAAVAVDREVEEHPVIVTMGMFSEMFAVV
jgi:hypothetical protein